MGGAVITQIIAGSRQLTVTLDRDDSRMILAKTAVDSSVTTLTEKVSSLELNVIEKQNAVDVANTNLQNAIDTEAPRETLVLRQEQVIITTSQLVNAKTELNTAKYQLASATQQQTRLLNEINRDLSVTISTADSGNNFELGDHIGIAEYARLSNPGSIYVALPSERITKPADWFLYDSDRDGVALPQLSEQPFGWWYNTMVVPSAQIFRPRYALGQLLSKDDDENTGTIYVYASADFKTRPIRPTNSLVINVPFDYETTNSKSFISGDLVLLEYQDISVSETPTIIGFGSEEILSSTAIAYHKDIVAFSFAGSRYMTWGIAHDINLPSQPEILPRAVVTNNGTDWTNPENEIKVLDWALPKIEAFYSNRVLTDVQNTVTVSEHHGFEIRSLEVNNDLVNWGENASVLFTDFNSVIPSARDNFQVTLIRPPPSSPFPVTPGCGGGGLVLDFPDDPRFNKTAVFPYYWAASWSPTSGSGGDSIKQDKISSINLNPPAEEPVEGQPSSPNLYTKLLNAKAGTKAPADWLWAEGNYVNPIAYNQFLAIKFHKNYIDDTFPGGSGAPSDTMFEIGPGTAYGSPADYSSIPAIAATGLQNLILFSEDLPSGQDALTNGSLVLSDLISPTNQPAGDVYLLQSLSGTAVPRYWPDHGSLSVADYTFSAFVRRDAFCLVHLLIDSHGIVEYDLIDKTAENLSGTVPNALAIEEIDEEWFRISVSYPMNTGSTDVMQINPNTKDTSDLNGLNGINVWGMQINSGNSAGEYVKTTGAVIP